jgi:hypothetical protein
MKIQSVRQLSAEFAVRRIVEAINRTYGDRDAYGILDAISMAFEDMAVDADTERQASVIKALHSAFDEAAF